MQHHTTLELPILEKVPLKFIFSEVIDKEASHFSAKFLMALSQENMVVPSNIDEIQAFILDKIFEYLDQETSSDVELNFAHDSLRITLYHNYFIAPIFYKTALETIKEDAPTYAKIFTATIANLNTHAFSWVDSKELDIDYLEEYLSDELQDESTHEDCRHKLAQLKDCPKFPKSSLSPTAILKKIKTLPQKTEIEKKLNAWIFKINSILTQDKTLYYQEEDTYDVIITPGELCSILYEEEHVTTELYYNRMEGYTNDGAMCETVFAIPFDIKEDFDIILQKLKSAFQYLELYYNMGQL